MKVYLDFDDVLCETFAELERFARAEFGKDPEPGKSVHFDLHESLGLSDAEYRLFMDRFHAERLLGIPEIPGACAAMRAWIAVGHEPVVVTGRPVSAAADSARWLAERGLAGVSVLHVDKFARFPDPDAPGVVPFPALASMGFGLAVEDAPAALDVLARSRLCPYAVFERPWNRDWAPPHGAAAPVLRARSWSDIAPLAQSAGRAGGA